MTPTHPTTFGTASTAKRGRVSLLFRQSDPLQSPVRFVAGASFPFGKPKDSSPPLIPHFPFTTFTLRFTARTGRGSSTKRSPRDSPLLGEGRRSRGEGKLCNPMEPSSTASGPPSPKGSPKTVHLYGVGRTGVGMTKGVSVGMGVAVPSRVGRGVTVG